MKCIQFKLLHICIPSNRSFITLLDQLPRMDAWSKWNMNQMAASNSHFSGKISHALFYGFYVDVYVCARFYVSRLKEEKMMAINQFC